MKFFDDISFSDHNIEVLDAPHRGASVLTIQDDYDINWILIDSEASMEVLFLSTI